MKIIEFLRKILSDQDGTPSSKRVIGIIAGLALIVMAFIYPGNEIFYMVLILSLGGLGLASIDKLTNLFSNKKDDPEPK